MVPQHSPRTDTHPDAGAAPVSWLELAERIVSRPQVLAAIVVGDRTKQQLADRFGIELHPTLGWSLPLSTVLTSLLCADLIYMQVCDGAWHHKPTKKGRALAAQQALTAQQALAALAQPTPPAYPGTTVGKEII